MAAMTRLARTAGLGAATFGAILVLAPASLGDSPAVRLDASAFAFWGVPRQHPREAYFVWVLRGGDGKLLSPRTFAAALRARCNRSGSCQTGQSRMREIPSQSFTLSPALSSASVSFRFRRRPVVVRWVGEGPIEPVAADPAADGVVGGDLLRGAAAHGRVLGKRLRRGTGAGSLSEGAFADAPAELSAAARQLLDSRSNRDSMLGKLRSALDTLLPRRPG